jgi:hypothetical protein
MIAGKKKKKKSASAKELSPHEKAQAEALRKAQREHAAALRSSWDSYCSPRVKMSGPPKVRQIDDRIEAGAIAAARAGDVSRLANLLRAHRQPTNEDLDALADFIEVTAKRAANRPRDEPVHEAAWLATIIMHMDKPLDAAVWVDEATPNQEEPKLYYRPAVIPYSDAVRVTSEKRDAAINVACKVIANERGVVVDPERVRDLLNRPKKRRR